MSIQMASKPIRLTISKRDGSVRCRQTPQAASLARTFDKTRLVRIEALLEARIPIGYSADTFEWFLPTEISPIIRHFQWQRFAATIPHPNAIRLTWVCVGC